MHTKTHFVFILKLLADLAANCGRETSFLALPLCQCQCAGISVFNGAAAPPDNEPAMLKTACVPARQKLTAVYARMGAAALAFLVGFASTVVPDATSTSPGERLGLENACRERLLDLLRAVLGAGNVRVEISAVVDFSHVEQTSEQFSPVDTERPADRSRNSATTNRVNPTVPVAEIERAQSALVSELRRLIASGRVSLKPAF